jgi:hypothetical protein
MDDNELYAQIAAAQAAAASKLQERYGLTAEQMTKASASLAAPKPSEPHTVSAADMEARWRRAAEGQFRSLGISPISDAEAAEITAAQERAVAAKKAATALDLDNQLHTLRSDWDRGQTDPQSIYYRADPALRTRMESNIMLARLEMGLPAEPAPPKTAVQLAQEQFEARKAQRS